jgi:hypothetical protein
VFKVGKILKRNKQVNFAEQDEAISGVGSTSNSRCTTSNMTARDGFNNKYQISLPDILTESNLNFNQEGVRLPRGSPQNVESFTAMHKPNHSEINLVSKGIQKTQQSIVQ